MRTGAVENEALGSSYSKCFTNETVPYASTVLAFEHEIPIYHHTSRSCHRTSACDLIAFKLEPGLAAVTSLATVTQTGRARRRNAVGACALVGYALLSVAAHLPTGLTP